MAESTGLVLAIGGITAANELLFAPLTGTGTPWKDFNWRIVPATGVLALALAGIEQLGPSGVTFAKGLAAIGLITVLFVRIGNAPAPAENLAKILGYNK